MAKRRWRIITVFLLILMVSMTTLAKPKTKKKAPAQPSKATTKVDVDFLARVFKVSREEVATYSRYELSTEELGLVFYLYSVAGRPFSEAELAIIIRQKIGWLELAWRFGLPPLIPEEGVFYFQRPWRPRILPPLEKKEYHQITQGEYEEVIEVKPNKYEYTYAHKRLGITEKLKVSRAKYEYSYEDQRLKETLRINLHNYKYEYEFKDLGSGKEIKRKGIGRPLTPEDLYRQLRQEQAKDPQFSLSIRINIRL